MIDKKEADCVKCNHRIDAFNKLIFFDLELVFDTYIQGLTDELEHGKDEVTSYAESLEQEVAQRTRELHQLARTDGLTKLLNQRHRRDHQMLVSQDPGSLSNTAF